MAEKKVCPTCTRPYKQLDNSQRARRGNYPGSEHQAAKQLGNLGPALSKVYAYLQLKKDRADELSDQEHAWVSSRKLRDVLDGGDGPRRARQLRDEYAVRMEIVTERRGDNPLMAYYRLLDSIETLEQQSLW